MNADPSLGHLLARLAVVELRVRAAVARKRAVDPEPDDSLRGLYLSDQDVDRILDAEVPLPAESPGDASEAECCADETEAQGHDIRLRRLARTFGLDELEVDLLLVALAPDVDARFERLYGYLHDDVTRRRASAGLALELCGRSPIDYAARARLAAGGPLVGSHLVVVGEQDRPFLTRSLRVPDRVASHLLGDDRPDAAVLPVLAGAAACGVAASELSLALLRGIVLAYIRERPGQSGRAFAASAFTTIGYDAVVLDLDRVAASEHPEHAATSAVREARLRSAGLVAGPVEALVDTARSALRRLVEAPWPVVLHGRSAWDPAWSREVPVILEVPATAPSDRAQLWAAYLDGNADPALDAAAATAAFRLDDEQVERAATAAKRRALSAGRLVAEADVRTGAVAQNAAGLDRLARRIDPEATWDDIVLPAPIKRQLCDVASRVRHRDRVLRDWALRGRQSVAALFAGQSGTGKTMACEVLARELGVDLYVVDLATVVDKYIGETEKNLDRIFVEAERVNGVLLFDEADALFGKRSEVHDARDRYANIEISYLLQRMETFEGIAVMTTNLRANIDDAFTRRLDAIVNFPMPDEQHRLEIWNRCLGPLVPREADVDLAFCARAFDLPGGDIRNITLAAAYMAAAEGRAVRMADLMRATGLEYQKLGRLCLEAEFGEHLQTATS